MYIPNKVSFPVTGGLFSFLNPANDDGCQQDSGSVYPID